MDTPACARYARTLGLSRLLRTGSGHCHIHANERLNADTFEAVLGAVHLDSRAAGDTAVPSPVACILAKVITGFNATEGAAAAPLVVEKQQHLRQHSSRYYDDIDLFFA